MKCSGCGVGFDNINLVMRARDRVYHVECFRCVTCQCRLESGDEFALRADDCALVCRQHFDHDADVTAAAQLPVPASSSSLTPANSDLLRVVEPRPPPPVHEHVRIHLPPTHHSHPPSHIHCSIPGSKLTFSTNLFHNS